MEGGALIATLTLLPATATIVMRMLSLTTIDSPARRVRTSMVFPLFECSRLNDSNAGGHCSPPDPFRRINEKRPHSRSQQEGGLHSRGTTRREQFISGT